MAGAYSIWQVLAAPAIALLGVLLGHALTRRSAKDADKRSRREETIRTLRWACEQTGSPQDSIRALGFAVLGELVKSELIQEEDRQFIEAVAAAGVAARTAEYGDGIDVESIEVADVTEVRDGQNAGCEGPGRSRGEVRGGLPQAELNDISLVSDACGS